MIYRDIEQIVLNCCVVLILHSGSDTETVHILLILLSSAALTKSCEERIAERLNVKIRKHY